MQAEYQSPALQELQRPLLSLFSEQVAQRRSRVVSRVCLVVAAVTLAAVALTAWLTVGAAEPASLAGHRLEALLQPAIGQPAPRMLLTQPLGVGHFAAQQQQEQQQQKQQQAATARIATPNRYMVIHVSNPSGGEGGAAASVEGSAGTSQGGVGLAASLRQRLAGMASWVRPAGPAAGDTDEAADAGVGAGDAAAREVAAGLRLHLARLHLTEVLRWAAAARSHALHLLPSEAMQELTSIHLARRMAMPVAVLVSHQVGDEARQFLVPQLRAGEAAADQQLGAGSSWRQGAAGSSSEEQQQQQLGSQVYSSNEPALYTSEQPADRFSAREPQLYDTAASQQQLWQKLQLMPMQWRDVARKLLRRL